MALHFMSDKELSRVEILRDLTAGRLTVSAASELMGLERRQVLRLSKAYQEHGVTALISKKRGRASNRQTPTEIKAEALELIKARYTDFGPTLAAEKLREVHALPHLRQVAARHRARRTREQATGRPPHPDPSESAV